MPDPTTHTAAERQAAAKRAADARITQDMVRRFHEYQEAATRRASAPSEPPSVGLVVSMWVLVILGIALLAISGLILFFAVFGGGGDACAPDCASSPSSPISSSP
jgi:hypothetical protein